ncbi:MAG: sigma 54-interacting transcriptional regulator [Nitrospinae bacterium]|nr:sigma 54-interacting transcriptional regulator [Nitrospinota bacterium]
MNANDEYLDLAENIEESVPPPTSADESEPVRAEDEGAEPPSELDEEPPAEIIAEPVAEPVAEIAPEAPPEIAQKSSPRKMPFRFSNIIGQSTKLKDIFNVITRLADTDSTVLVLGESGTGKELFARAIHWHSPRRDRNFVTVNCGAIPEELLESELFGHEKGSFTGAIRTRIGKFEMAHEGTIFLDEIGDMSPTLQVKLLRILQQQEFERVGSNQVIKTNVRVLAATNQNLEKAIKEKRFREDLFYRLNVIPLKLPPLRDRKDDLPLLIDHFMKRFNKSKNRNITGVLPEAMALMQEYDWPGNVRELENICERMAVIKGEGVIEVDDLPMQFRSDSSAEEMLYQDMLLVGAQEAELETPAQKGPVMEIPETGINLKEVVEEYEMALILQALEKCNWVKNKAATLLGLNRTTLVEKLKKKGITR